MNVGSLKSYIEKRRGNRPLYMPYLTVGDPDVESTFRYALRIIDEGADILELGIPFSDPTADGPTIEKAMVRAMAKGDFSIHNVLEITRRIHEERPSIPLVYLTYFNPVIRLFMNDVKVEHPDDGYLELARFSIERFLKEAYDAGIRGMVIPDLPYDQREGILIREEGAKVGVDIVQLITPTTSPSRKEELCNIAMGFLYYVTSTGVTGERNTFPENMVQNIQSIKRMSGLPVFAGFGFSRPEQVDGIGRFMDGVIVGSLNHRIIDESTDDAGEQLAGVTRSFIQALERESA